MYCLAVPLVLTALIYRGGDGYKECGVMLLDILPAGVVRGALFDRVEVQNRHSKAVMVALDGLNKRFGCDTLTVVAAGTQKRWAARAEQNAAVHDPMERPAQGIRQVRRSIERVASLSCISVQTISEVNWFATMPSLSMMDEISNSMFRSRNPFETT
jgi:hypothetical protein